MGQMQGLALVDLSSNRIEELPLTLRHLKHLHQLDVANNPLKLPPAHVCLCLQANRRLGSCRSTTLIHAHPQVCARGRVHIFKYLKDEAEARDGPSSPSHVIPADRRSMFVRGSMQSRDRADLLLSLERLEGTHAVCPCSARPLTTRARSSSLRWAPLMK
jgi:hypothetical protein